MGSRRLDIAIAGCGTAGLSAALLLARDGHQVTLFERFEAPRPVGSGLMIQPTGLAVLDAMGLGEAIVRSGARIDRLFGQSVGSGRTALDVRYAALGASRGLGIHRAALFGLLHRAVLDAGLPIETGRTVRALEAEGVGKRLVFVSGGREGPFDLVVDALGSRSPLAPDPGRELDYGALWASLDWPDAAGFDGHALEQRYRAASVMAGVLPIGAVPGRPRRQAAFFWSLRRDQLELWRTAGLATWKTGVTGLWPALGPLLDQIASPDQLTFAGYTHRTLASPIGPALVHIGDSWHSTSPQLGQGANMALLDAYALAMALRRAPDVAAALRLYLALRGGHVRLYQVLSVLFTPVYQSDSWLFPWLRDGLVGPLASLWPADKIQTAMVSGLIGDPLGRLGLKGRVNSLRPV